MKKIIFVGLVLLFMGCDTNKCILMDFCPIEATLIDSAKKSSNKVEVYSYSFKGQTLYSINQCTGCPDDMATLYDCDGKMLCNIGGIAGFQCLEYKDALVTAKLVYKNY